MKKRSFMPSWGEVLIPVLPLLPYLVSCKAGLSIACSGAAISLMLAAAVKMIERIFNKEQLLFLYMLASGVSVYALNVFWELPAALVLSLCLLGPAGRYGRKNSTGAGSIFLNAVLFFVFSFSLGAAQEFLGGVLHLSFFQRVSGSLLLLLIPALFWPASRKVKGRTRYKFGFTSELYAS